MHYGYQFFVVQEIIKMPGSPDLPVYTFLKQDPVKV